MRESRICAEKRLFPKANFFKKKKEKFNLRWCCWWRWWVPYASLEVRRKVVFHNHLMFYHKIGRWNEVDGFGWMFHAVTVLNGNNIDMCSVFSWILIIIGWGENFAKSKKEASFNSWNYILPLYSDTRYFVVSLIRNPFLLSWWWRMNISRERVWVLEIPKKNLIKI